MQPIDARPAGRLVSLLRTRAARPDVMRCFWDRPLSDEARSALAEALSFVAVELEHAIEEGRQDALIAARQAVLKAAV